MKVLVLFIMAAAWVASGDLHIGTAEEYLNFSARVTSGEASFYGETVYITDDLDFDGLTFDPPGDFEVDQSFWRAFQGSLEGGGHLVQNLRYEGGTRWNVGFVAVAYGNTSIRGFVIDKTCLFNNTYGSEFSCTAGGVAYAIGTLGFMRIESVVNLGGVVYHGPDETPILGSVAGYIQDAVVVKDCVGAGWPLAASVGFVGGVVGYAIGASEYGYSWIINSYYDMDTYRGGVTGLLAVTKVVNASYYDDTQRIYTNDGRRTGRTLLDALAGTALSPVVLAFDRGNGTAHKMYAPVVRRLPVPTRLGYTFVGWYTDPNFTSPFIINNITYNPYIYDANITVYAQWRPGMYYVHFQMGGAGAIEPLGFEYLSVVTALPQPEWHRPFKHWCLDFECNTYVSQEGFSMPARNITVYPQWGSAELDSGLIALIIVLVVAFLAAAGAAGTVLARVVYHRRHSAPPGMTVLPDGTITLDSGYLLASKVDLSGSALVKSREKFPLDIDAEALSFGLARGEAAPLDTPLQMKFTLRNKLAGKRAWEILPENFDKYTLLFNPSSGVLSHNDTVRVTAQITMNCTTAVNTTVPIITWISKKNTSQHHKHQQQRAEEVKEKEEEEERFINHNQDQREHYLMKLKIESENSIRLDPDDIKLIQTSVGEGAFGTVFKGFYKSQTVAVKVVKNQASPERMEELYDAADVMKNFHSIFLVGLVGVVTFPGKMSLVTEFAPYGSYADASKRADHNLPLIFRTRAAYDTAKGLRFLHNAGFAHCCLSTAVVYVFSMDVLASVCCKLGNLRAVRATGSDVSDDVISGNGGDEGAGLGVGPGCNSSSGNCETPSPMYTAPELLKCTKHSVKTDVFTLGATLYEMFTGKVPCPEQPPDPRKPEKALFSADKIRFPNQVPEKVVKLIKKCWSKKPTHRPGKDVLLLLLLLKRIFLFVLIIILQAFFVLLPENDKITFF